MTQASKKRNPIQQSLVENAINDPRSVSAWLRGRGDGRVALYESYLKASGRDNAIDVGVDGELRDRFEEKVRPLCLQNMKKARPKQAFNVLPANKAECVVFGCVAAFAVCAVFLS